MTWGKKEEEEEMGKSQKTLELEDIPSKGPTCLWLLSVFWSSRVDNCSLIMGHYVYDYEY